jgi:hypothetical protein
MVSGTYKYSLFSQMLPIIHVKLIFPNEKAVLSARSDRTLCSDPSKRFYGRPEDSANILYSRSEHFAVRVIAKGMARYTVQPCSMAVQGPAKIPIDSAWEPVKPIS